MDDIQIHTVIHVTAAIIKHSIMKETRQDSNRLSEHLLRPWEILFR